MLALIVCLVFWHSYQQADLTDSQRRVLAKLHRAERILHEAELYARHRLTEVALHKGHTAATPLDASVDEAEQAILDAENDLALEMSRAHYSKALRNVTLPTRHRHSEAAVCTWRDMLVVIGGFNVSESELHKM